MHGYLSCIAIESIIADQDAFFVKRDRNQHNITFKVEIEVN